MFETVCEMTDEQKCVIEKYVGLTEQCAEEENQQAYLQGMVDMLLLLSGSGILKVPSNMLETERKNYRSDLYGLKRVIEDVGNIYERRHLLQLFLNNDFPSTPR